MTAIMVRLLVIAALAAFVGGLVLGHRWGKSDGSTERTQLSTDLATRTAERDTAQLLAGNAAGTTKSLRDSLTSERQRRLDQQKAAADELSMRSQRITTLERQATALRQKLNNQVIADENCTALRTQPVCAAVADGLWGK
ncbi:hypothetical protein KWH04_01090 [Xanthomonas campestris pv. trichodesmae]|uniref:Endopeptidase n=2 Tax=Xanthomonas citri TaxID=346 RepID=A0AB33C8X7_XANCI|nr:hypothetical protein [Xanthomonas citri]ASK91064.1 hypothetical protein XcvCFBP7111P_05720 [Xanthomonas citri pv. vignicola]MBV6779265.1 hypothetical protein [Xanthomonas campestris pv. trichodesmae]MBZ3921779.1 hypothetical protein [Xanthomonas campestris pv. trichodesmae]MBZ3926379.1 hypothetical protein [Xanthomonas citri pv. sesbaniae]